MNIDGANPRLKGYTALNVEADQPETIVRALKIAVNERGCIKNRVRSGFIHDQEVVSLLNRGELIQLCQSAKESEKQVAS